MTQEQMQSKPTVATTLVTGDKITVNLVASNTDTGQRVAVNAVFNHLGERVSADGQSMIGELGLDLSLLSGHSAPEFPMAKYNHLIETGQLEAAEDIKFAHEQDVEAWKAKGNLPIQDAIGHAVLNWAGKVHNVSTNDHDGLVIRPEQVVVKSVVRSTPDEAGVFIVQLTPSWG